MLNFQFIQKADLYTSVKASVRTDQAPDIFWLEPDEIGFAKSGYIEPLDKYINLDNLEDWARLSTHFNLFDAGSEKSIPANFENSTSLPSSASAL